MPKAGLGGIVTLLQAVQNHRPGASKKKIMDKTMSNFHFKIMCLSLKLRDLFLPPKSLLMEIEIAPGFHILDYGCGPGSYSIVAAKMVGPAGRVYALDIHPLSIQRVQNMASKKRLTNIQTIQSDCATGLENGSIDVVLFYDTFHLLADPNAMLDELHRVLKPNGILSFSDHNMKQNEIIRRITNRGLFRLSKKGKRTYSFLKDKGNR